MENQTITLDNNIIEQIKHFGGVDRVPHAILVTGDKAYDYSVILSSYMLCENDNKPCGNCISCKKILANIHPDVTIVEGGDTRKSFHIDKIREIRSSAYILPNESNIKIYILKNAQNMTEQAQNSLLKILEEPPNFVMFILVADNFSSLLPTILSRVVRVNLSNNVKCIDEKSKSYLLAEEIAFSITKSNNYELLLATSLLTKKKDTAFLSNTFNDLYDIFYQALLFKATDNNITESSVCLSIYSTFTLKQINDIISLLDKIKSYILCNANKNILITYFSKAVKDIKEQV